MLQPERPNGWRLSSVWQLQQLPSWTCVSVSVFIKTFVPPIQLELLISYETFIIALFLVITYAVWVRVQDLPLFAARVLLGRSTSASRLWRIVRQGAWRRRRYMQACCTKDNAQQAKCQAGKYFIFYSCLTLLLFHFDLISSFILLRRLLREA